MKKIILTLLAVLALPLISVQFISAGADGVPTNSGSGTIFDVKSVDNGQWNNFADFIDPITILSPRQDQVFRTMPRNAGLGWQADGDAVSYEVELNCEWCNPASKSPWSETVVKKIHYYTHWITPALARDGNYRFRVRGIAKNGWHGSWSEHRYFSYDTRNIITLPKRAESKLLDAPTITAPAAEQEFSHYPRITNLQWEAVPGAGNYEVQFACDTCASATNKWTGAVKYVTKETSFHFDNLAGMNDYRFRVRGLEENGFAGPWSEYRYFSFLK